MLGRRALISIEAVRRYGEIYNAGKVFEACECI